MEEFKPFVNGTGGTVVELGSRDGHDANKMQEIFGATRVITIEANPDCWKDINRSYPHFENINAAVTNKTGDVDFYKVGHEFGPTVLGQSSTLYKPSYAEIATKITVPGWTMDDLMDHLNVTEIEALKIDVEGATYEVLQGFSEIRMTRLIHLETELVQFWEDQKVHDEVAKYLNNNGFEQVYYQPVWTDQADTIWRRI